MPSVLNTDADGYLFLLIPDYAEYLPEQDLLPEQLTFAGGRAIYSFPEQVHVGDFLLC